MNTRHYAILAVLLAAIPVAMARAQEEASVDLVDFKVQLDTICSGFDGKMCWVHPRAGAIPGNPPSVVMTMQKLQLSGSDVFYALNTMRTDDLGKTWTGPAEEKLFGRRWETPEVELTVCDFTPKWHAASKTLLGTGHTVRYRDNKVTAELGRSAVYAVYDQEKRAWKPWQILELPDAPEFFNAGSGSTQRYDLPNGDILLPIYHRSKEVKTNSTTVVRCRFDGEKLSYVEHGNSMSVDIKRGLYEPSVTEFGDRFYLTMRNDDAAYVSSGPDGLHFDEPAKWRFDDGEELGSYNTQQHWVTSKDGLFLVYTRKGANNDHVFRHRAPLFIGQVDPKRLCVIRASERILVPERGARLGNFAVCEVSRNEVWVTVAEWMQPEGCEQHGSDNSVYAARIFFLLGEEERSKEEPTR